MFAKLSKSLTSGATAGQLLRELSQVIAGVITDKSQLTVFNKNLSQIIPGNSNWEVIYPWGWYDNISTYSFRSLCAGQTKYKFARLYLTSSAAPFSTEPNGGLAYNGIVSAGLSYLVMHSARSMDGYGNQTQMTYNDYSNVNFLLGAADLYVSASNGHLIIYSDNSVQSNVSLYGIFEYPENQTTANRGLTPVIAYRGKGQGLTSNTTAKTNTGPVIAVSQMPDAINGTATSQNILVSIDNSTAGCMTAFDFGTSNSDIAGIPEGALDKYFLRNLIFYDAARMHNFGNCSFLSDVYFIQKTGARFSVGQEFKSGLNSYVALPLTNGSLIVPKR